MYSADSADAASSAKSEGKTEAKATPTGESKTEAKAVPALPTTPLPGDGKTDQVSEWPEGEVGEETESVPQSEGGKGSSEARERSEAPRWEPITTSYGPWVDDMKRLRYAFDARDHHSAVYAKYGWNSVVPELDHRVVRYHQRMEIYKAKTAFLRREEYLTAFQGLPEVIRLQEQARGAWMNMAASRATSTSAQEAMESLPLEIVAFRLYAMNVNPMAPRTGGFVFYSPNEDAKIFAWREGTREVKLEMEEMDADGNVSSTTDRKRIFTYMGADTAIMHEVFHAKSHREVMDAILGFLSEGWAVIPNGAYGLLRPVA